MGDKSSNLNAMSTVGASAASGVMGYFSTRYAAKKASEEAQKNRDFQLQMAEKERSETLEDRAHAEMYNSPLMERMRREAAGLGPVDDYSTPGTPAQGLAPDYAEATKGSGDALVSAAQLGASAPMVMMQRALEAAKTSAQIMKDRSEAAESLQSGRLKAITAKLQELGLNDDLAKKRLENDYLFEKTNNLLKEGYNLVESGKLTRVQRKKAEVDLDIVLRTQELKVELAKQEVEQSKIKTRLDEKQLYDVLPKQLKLMDSEIARANAAANLANSQSRRINVLLPFEAKEMQNSISLLGLALKSGTIDYDEQLAKHNKFMSHLKEYEDALVANYKLSRSEANWYAVKQGADLITRAASTAVMGVGIGKAFSAVPAVTSTASTLKNGGLVLAGSGAFEKLSGALGNTIPRP